MEHALEVQIPDADLRISAVGGHEAWHAETALLAIHAQEAGGAKPHRLLSIEDDPRKEAGGSCEKHFGTACN